MNEILDRCRCWNQGNGSIAITFYIRNAMSPGETEDEFIKRADDLIRRDWGVVWTSTLDKLSDLPPLSTRRQWRRNPQGKIVIDPTIVPQDVKDLQDKRFLRLKLKAMGLTEREVDLLGLPQ